ncbi:MAG: hypothetical protein HW420_729 [Candidatus Nitrosotenuis sp.]|nr:hypothetical protein [Candidatus Nitrosotenuis sp.]
MKSKTISAEKGNRLQSNDDIFQNIQKYNPTLKNILKVEQLFIKHKEFDSKVQIAKKLDVAMRPPVLNVILKYLERSNKILIDSDGSLVWIYASPKAKSSWEKAARL